MKLRARHRDPDTARAPPWRFPRPVARERHAPQARTDPIAPPAGILPGRSRSGRSGMPRAMLRSEPNPYHPAACAFDLSAVAIVARLTHHGDDLLHRRRVRGIQLPLVAGRATGVIAGHTVAGERRLPAASSTAETVMGSPPNCTADRARRSTSAHAAAGGIAPEIASLSLRVADAQAVGSSRRRPTLVQGSSEHRGAVANRFAPNARPDRVEIPALSRITRWR